MNIVIAGAGEVGSHLAKMLAEEKNNNLTIIDKSEARLEKLSEIADVVTLAGDPTSIEVLMTAGVDKADLFVAVSPASEQDINIISALLAKKMGSKKVTARINNEEYLTHENRILFTELGIDLLFYPEKIASYEIIDLLKQTGTMEFMEFARGRLQMVAFRLEDGAPLLEKTVGEFEGAFDAQYRVVAIARNGSTLIPSQQERFIEKDLLFVICTREGVESALSFSGKPEIDIKKLMIVGGGRIGEILARKMEGAVDSIKIIEQRQERCEYLAAKLGDNVLAINGDGRNTDILVEENVKECDALVAVTSNSETNILTCVAAKRMGVPKTIAEVENIEYIKLAEGMGVDAVINKKLITAGRIFRFTLSNKVRSIKCLNGSDADVLEFIVSPGSKITKGKIKDLGFPSQAIIGGIVRGNESIIATPDTEIMPYDRVVVFALPEELERTNKFFI